MILKGMLYVAVDTGGIGTDDGGGLVGELVVGAGTVGLVVWAAVVTCTVVVVVWAGAIILAVVV
jgi:hypothetical protein